MRKFKKLTTLLLVSFIFLQVFSITGCKQADNKITSYQIECALENNTLKGKETVTFYNNTDNAFSELKFNLFANAFRKDAKYSPIATQYKNKAYYQGESYGEIQITSVKSVDKSLSYEICGEDKNILVVNLEEEVFPNEKVEVIIEFTTILANVISRTGINEKTINLGNFYPILCGIYQDSFYECLYYSNGDPFYSDCANYEVSITLNKNYVVSSSAKETSSTTLGENVKHTYVGKNIRSFSMVLSKEFKVIKDHSTGVEVNYYYYDDEHCEDSLKTAVKSLIFFSETFGVYPYETYSVVQTKFIQGGMEYPGLVMISDELEKASYEEVIIHETAHQWWMAVVGNNEIEYGFLDEGLAEYSVILFYENHSEYGLTRQQLIKTSELTYKTFCSVYDKLFMKVNTKMLRSLGEYDSEYEYVNISYIKPCIMYDSLRETIGEEEFFNSLKEYFTQYQFKNATPYDLTGIFEKCGNNTNGFFESFFDGKVII